MPPGVVCFVHAGESAVGLCSACRKAVCRRCVAREAPRLICVDCSRRGAVLGFEYKTKTKIGGWPLLHVCNGLDATTMRPKIARGVVAVGNVAVGGIAVGGVALGLFSLGGLAVGVLLAVGGAALGIGVSLGGLAVGSVAVGGAAVGFQYALGGTAIAPFAIDGRKCDVVAREFLRRWLGDSALPPSCRR